MDIYVDPRIFKRGAGKRLPRKLKKKLGIDKTRWVLNSQKPANLRIEQIVKDANKLSST